ncbi:hypothetical protein LWI28_003467 [Acer negundo]|uniref:Uncharacterized protein n=1 Tax=Acer negundo TaxID=4023 RepID=A0AAD5P0Z0_ACENE|nr:hypothetical protein LWI28_003467 [Acer negundo]
MKALVWNARGLGSSRTVRALLKLWQGLDPDLVFVVELKSDNGSMERLRVKLGFVGKLVVEAAGRSEGLVLFWSKRISVDLGLVGNRKRQLKTPSGAWNSLLLKELFWDDEVSAIQSIPCSNVLRDDSLCWHFVKDGSYTVKSGYIVGCMRDDTHSSSRSNDTGFRWSLCKTGFKSTFHALWACSRWKSVGSAFGVLKGTKWDGSIGFKDFFLFCVNNLTQQELALMCIICWILWFLRNHYVHEGGLIELNSVVDWCKNYLVECKAAIGGSVVSNSGGSAGIVRTQ